MGGERKKLVEVLCCDDASTIGLLQYMDCCEKVFNRGPI